MRASDGCGNKKQSSSRPIRKKKRRSRRPPYRRNRRDYRMEIFECVNETFRNHIRSGQGNWKLLPKDSLMVYRQQRDRQQKRKRDKKIRSESTFSSRLSCSETSMSVSHEASTTDTEDYLTQ